jgi:hypothetical protein
MATDRLVEDVRGDHVPLVPPFSEVTAVVVDGFELPAEAYRVTPHGIRLYGYGGFGLGRGTTITASFGAAVPETIKQATVLLAVDLLDDDGDGLIPSNLPANVESFSVDGLSVTFVGGLN